MSYHFDKKDQSFVVKKNVYALEAFFPEIYTSRGLFEVISNEVVIVGVFALRAYNTKTAYDSKKPSMEYPVGICNRFVTKPSINEKVEDTVYGSKGTYRKLTYFPGDIIMKDRSVILDNDNIGNLFSIMDDGKLSCFPYLFIVELYDSRVFYDNGKAPSAPIESIHAIVSDKYRNPKDITVPVRMMNPIPKSIIPVNPREAVSTSTSESVISFEDTNTAILIGHNKAKRGEVDRITQIEKIQRGIYDKK